MLSNDSVSLLVLLNVGLTMVIFKSTFKSIFKSMFFKSIDMTYVRSEIN